MIPAVLLYSGVVLLWGWRGGRSEVRMMVGLVEYFMKIIGICVLKMMLSLIH